MASKLPPTQKESVWIEGCDEEVINEVRKFLESHGWKASWCRIERDKESKVMHAQYLMTKTLPLSGR
jgi:hypothetical protein